MEEAIVDAALTLHVRDDSLAALAAEHAGRLGVPGLTVVLVSQDDQRLVFDGQVGGGPVSDTSWFQAASSGKHVLACVVLQFVERERIELGAPIGRYLADLPDEWASRSVGSLLHHTSGLPDYLAVAAEPAPTDRAGFMARAAHLPPIAAEGRLWSYSNSNYILLGFLAAELGERSAGLAMQSLLDRAGGGAAVASPDWVREVNAQRLGEDARDDASLMRTVIGDGDVAFTAQGAANWLGALLRDPPGGTALFAAGTCGGMPIPYGCGLFVERSGGDEIAHHAGHYDGWTAMLLLNRMRQAGAFVLAAVAPGNTRAVRAIAQEMLEAYRPGATPRALRPIPDAAPGFTAVVRDQLLRGERPIDPARFAPAMRIAIERAGSRGVLDLWAGTAPDAFELVDHYDEGGRTMRRYRLTYPQRVEHLLAGMSTEGLIDWAWPL